MNETPQQYTERILSYQRGKEPMKILAATPARIAALIAKSTPARMKSTPAPGKWCTSEILAHLADAELVFAFRLRLVLGSNGVTIQAFNQDVWAKSFLYGKQNWKQSFETFRTVRKANIALLRRIPPEQWEFFGMHQERGKETVTRMTEMYAGHDINHTMQIQERMAGLKG